VKVAFWVSLVANVLWGLLQLNWFSTSGNQVNLVCGVVSLTVAATMLVVGLLEVAG
jgi:hypothetical protein